MFLQKSVAGDNSRAGDTANRFARLTRRVKQIGKGFGEETNQRRLPLRLQNGKPGTQLVQDFPNARRLAGIQGTALQLCHQFGQILFRNLEELTLEIAQGDIVRISTHAWLTKAPGQDQLLPQHIFETDIVLAPLFIPRGEQAQPFGKLHPLRAAIRGYLIARHKR